MVVIIGAGISGLTCAYELHKHNIPFLLFEAGTETGGWIKSTKSEGRVFEHGPNSLMLDKTTEKFLKEINLHDRIIESNPISKERFILKNGRIKALPSSPPKLLFNNALSLSSKISLIKELFRKPQSNTKEETIGSFIERHFNEEIKDYLLDPFITGVYAGNCEELLAELVFPKLLDYERKYGSIIKGLKEDKSIERRKIITFPEGLQEITHKLTSLIPAQCIQLNTSVSSIKKYNEGYQVETSNGIFEARSIINASSPSSTIGTMKDLLPEFAHSCKRINTAPVGVLHVVISKVNLKHAGFGVLIPKKEQRTISGFIMNSVVFDQKCKEDELLFTCIIGGRGRERVFDNDEDSIIKLALKDLESLIGRGFEIKYTHYEFHPSTIPQYDIELKKARNKLKETALPNVYHATNWTSGVSIPDCIKGACEITEKIRSFSAAQKHGR